MNEWDRHYEEDDSSSSSSDHREAAQKTVKSSTAHLYVFTNEKGGMEGYNKNLQQQVIEELSRGSKHLEHAKRSDTRLTKKIQAMKERLDRLDDKTIQKNLKTADELLTSLEKDRPLGRWCAVVDMDMFYAAVEIKDNPHLATIPIAVGGKSMISTTNYVARKYGVRAAMPGFIGEELCRRQGAKLTFVNHHNKRYREEATVVRSVFAKYGPFSSFSLDEAEIDMTNCVAEYSKNHNISEVEAAERILSNLRNDIFEATQLTASGAIGTNFLLAKIGADVNKPNGQFVTPTTTPAIREWMAQMPIRKIPGIGKVSERFLKEALNVHTVGDVIEKRAIVVCLLDSPKSIIRACLGISKNKLADYSSLPPAAVKRQSIGAETTFSGETNEQVLLTTLAKLCSKVSSDMERNGGLAGKTVVIKIKKTDFQVLTRQMPIPRYIKTDKDIYTYASALLEKEFPLSVRLLGVRITKFKNQISYKDAKDVSQLRLTSFCKKKVAAAEGQKPDTTDGVDLPKQNNTSEDADRNDIITVDDTTDDDDDNDDEDNIPLMKTTQKETTTNNDQEGSFHKDDTNSEDLLFGDDAEDSKDEQLFFVETRAVDGVKEANDETTTSIITIESGDDNDDPEMSFVTRSNTKESTDQPAGIIYRDGIALDEDSDIVVISQSAKEVSQQQRLGMKKSCLPLEERSPVLKRQKTGEPQPIVLSLSSTGSQQLTPKGTVASPIELD
eukprot:TRINITY_DN4264_c0_g1_i1.p1 TRINITY_DN4264_c0_g1~~TRINITY_DN4264_c0_g1_i1.p1  ORF type:complete len:726 (+),score=138.38 TRINITY_DN4264_c0_g1_i1:78-2255(+)